MPRTLLLTTGTSIANGTPALGAYQKHATSWEGECSDLREQIRKRLKEFDLSSATGRVRASAELNILHRLPVKPNDEVVLFSSDTADGRACTEELKRVIQHELGVAEVEIEPVKGLQVRDAESLRHLGLSNLTRQLISYLDDPQRRYSGGCVLCPNGGFKGVVPFLTVLGMIFRAPVVYVFEFAETVISLPPLPIGFATDLLERALPALDWANNAGVFDVTDFHRRIPGFSPGEAALFDSFLEITPDSGDDRLGSLSPLASVLIERELGGASLRLSPRAVRAMEKLSATERREVEHHLAKLKSSLWRSQHQDSKPSSDLEFYPRGHNPWRFAGFTESGVFHLCWFSQHDAYERLIGQSDRHRPAFPMETFSDYSVPSYSDSQSEEKDPYQKRTWNDLRDEIESLVVENKRLKAMESVALQNTRHLQKLLHESRRKNDELTSTNRKLQDCMELVLE